MLPVVLLLLVCTLHTHPAWALYSSTSKVVSLTSANFDSKVTNSDDVWLVEFFAPWCGHCRSLVPEYEKLSKALRGVVRVGAVDADADKELGGRFGIRGFPTIKIFAGNKQKPIDYEGERTADKIAERVLDIVRRQVREALGGRSSSSGDSSDSSDVIELTDADFNTQVLRSKDAWLVEFYAPWCGHCKNLAPHWQKAAGALKGKMKLGAVDATVHAALAQRYDIKGYPTIKYFVGGEVQEYDGGRTADDIIAWANEKVVANVEPPTVDQLLTSEEFTSGAPLYVVTFVPHIYDCQAACRRGYLDVVTALGAKYKLKQWRWLWSQAGDQPALEAALDVGGFGYPAMAVVNVKKMKYTLLRGAFSNAGIDEFLRDLSYGRGSTAPVRGAVMPTLEAVEKWDGKDAEMPVDEDIDLSDVDLDSEEHEEDVKKDEL